MNLRKYKFKNKRTTIIHEKKYNNVVSYYFVFRYIDKFVGSINQAKN